MTGATEQPAPASRTCDCVIFLGATLTQVESRANPINAQQSSVSSCLPAGKPTHLLITLSALGQDGNRTLPIEHLACWETNSISWKNSSSLSIQSFKGQNAHLRLPL